MEWKQPDTKPKYMSPEDFAKIPDKLAVRIIKFKITAPRMRTRSVILVTTLLDPKTYPVHELADLYLKRWRAELTFRNLKSVMRMDVLRCKSPAMVQKEILMHLIAHNLVRLLMQEAALTWCVPLHRISFKGALDTFREFVTVMGCKRNARYARGFYTKIIAAIAAGRVPERPGRREPRAVKRRPKNHQWLTAPRHLFKEYRHRGKYPNRRWS